MHVAQMDPIIHLSEQIDCDSGVVVVTTGNLCLSLHTHSAARVDNDNFHYRRPGSGEVNVVDKNAFEEQPIR